MNVNKKEPLKNLLSVRFAILDESMFSIFKNPSLVIISLLMTSIFPLINHRTDIRLNNPTPMSIDDNLPTIIPATMPKREPRHNCLY